MRARITSAACCISSSGSRTAAIRCATEEMSAIWEARCRLCASARRSASFARCTSRARSAARAPCSCASTSRRADSSSCATSSASRRRSPSSSSATSASASASLSGHTRTSTLARQRSSTRISSASPSRLAPRRASCCARLDSAARKASTSPVASCSEQRVERARAAVAGVGLGDAAHVGDGTHPVGEHAVALRPDPLRGLLQRHAQAAHRGFSPRCRHAMPKVSGSIRTDAKPASSMSAANAFGLGNAWTDAGRYE